ncbi:phiSA1p31-related protein [Streptomyces scopuliridis]|uniref:phiSA1p31-related protein n=1 Tax=Streptomyces scopuliridis TaxID=452529 RepID=UPI0036A9807F
MSEQTFKVGDRVTVDRRGDGVVTYGPVEGPYGGQRIVVKLDGGVETAVNTSNVTVIPTFAIGDKAKMYGESNPVEIIGGPFTNRYHTWFAVRAEVGETMASESDLTAPPTPAPIAVGDRVRVTEDDPYSRTGEFVGQRGTVRRLNGSSRLPYHVEFDAGQGAPHTRWNVTSVEKITDESADTYRYEGITYDLTAQYTDRDGDAWRFARVDGVVRGDWSGARNSITSEDSTLSYVVTRYGPMTKI